MTKNGLQGRLEAGINTAFSTVRRTVSFVSSEGFQVKVGPQIGNFPDSWKEDVYDINKPRLFKATVQVSRPYK